MLLRKLKSRIISLACLLDRDFRAIRNSGLFERSYYLVQNPDVVRSGIDPLVHFFRHGVREERNPNPMFDVKYYLRKYPLIKESGKNPLIHYARLGPDGREDLNMFIGKFSYRPKISIIALIDKNCRKSLKKFIRSVAWQYYSDWELFIVQDGGNAVPYAKKVVEDFAENMPETKIEYIHANKSAAEALNEAAGIASGEFIVYANTNDLPGANALCEVARLLNKCPETDVIYSDEYRIAEDGLPLEYVLRPDWSPDFFYGVSYIEDFFIVRRELAIKTGLLRGEFAPVHFYDFLLRLYENTDKIEHLPKVIYYRNQTNKGQRRGLAAEADLRQLCEKAVSSHLKRRKISASVKVDENSQCMILYPKKKEYYPLVSLIIPFVEEDGSFHKSIETIHRDTDYRAIEVLFAGVISSNQDLQDLKEGHEIKLINRSTPANLSKVINNCVNRSRGDYIIILDGNTEIMTPEWIKNLLFYAEQPDIAAVGPYIVQSGGKVVAPSFLLRFRDKLSYGHSVNRYPEDSSWVGGFLKCAHEVPFVPLTCLMMKKELFLEAGGLNEHLFSFYQDIDLCLRFIERGYRNIYSPTAVIRKSMCGFIPEPDFLDRALILDQWPDAVLLD